MTCEDGLHPKAKEAITSRFIDISLGIGPDLLVFPGDPGIEVRPASRRSRGDPANVSQLHLGTHTGTHVDPPWHFVDGGATVDELAPEVFFGPAAVADLRGAIGDIGPAELEELALPEAATRLLLRTRNSELWKRLPAEFPDRYVALGVEGARWMVDRGIRLVGIDFLSIEAGGPPDFPVHHTLLEAGVVIVEGLDLRATEPGDYTLACFPLKLLEGDGAPARAVLIEP